MLCQVYQTCSFFAFFIVAKRETEAAQARSESRRSQPIHERPRRVGGTANYSATITQKQKAITAASKGLEIQVNFLDNLFYHLIGYIQLGRGLALRKERA